MLLVMLLNDVDVDVDFDDGGYNDDVDDEDASKRQGRSADLTVESTCGRLTTRRCGRWYDDDNIYWTLNPSARGAQVLAYVGP